MDPAMTDHHPHHRHCEERSDAAIQWASEPTLDCFASLAMMGQVIP
jgi:hypothetical protein